jgi:hypothetical protein
VFVGPPTPAPRAEGQRNSSGGLKVEVIRGDRSETINY